MATGGPSVVVFASASEGLSHATTEDVRSMQSG